MAAVPADLPLAPQADAAQDIAIEFAALGKRYPGAAADAPPALQNIDLRIRRGEIFGIIGRSGAGKSSLLRTINRLESPSSGCVLIDGVDIATLDSAALVALRRRIGMVFQHFNLLAAKTVADNIGLPLRIAGASRAAIEARVAELLELVGLGGRGRQYPARLSGGQKQRVGIARALAHHPQILLCDEATSALDPETTQAILQLLRDINRRLGITIVLITHEMSVIREVCDRVLVLDHGCIAESGPVWEVFGAPLHAATRALLQPLEHAGLPEDLAARLSAQPPDGAHEALIELSFTGAEGREPELGRIAAGLGGAVRLLHGGVDRIQGRSHGRLLLAVQRAAGAQVWPRSGRFAHSLKVLGYVTADA